jgi:triacylglycerol lipase
MMRAKSCVIYAICYAICLFAGLSCNRASSKHEYPIAHEVDFYNVLKYAIMSQVVYKPDELIKNYFDQYDVFIGNLPDRSVKYLILTDRKNKTQFLAIQGTKYFKNVIMDLEFTERKDLQLGIKLHRGFDKAGLELYKDIVQGNLLSKECPIHLTGHSSGGAIAIIVAMYLKNDGFQVSRIVTFGQPKITDAEGAAKCRNLPLLRIVNQHDEISFLPWSSDKAKYIHFGPEVLLLKEYYYSFGQETGPEMDISQDFLSNFAEENMQEHHLRHYFRNLTYKLSKNIEVPLWKSEEYRELE